MPAIELKYETAEGENLVEIKEYPGLKIPEKYLSRIRDAITIDSAKSWQKKLRSEVGELIGEDFEWDKSSAREIGEAIKSAIENKTTLAVESVRSQVSKGKSADVEAMQKQWADEKAKLAAEHKKAMNDLLSGSRKSKVIADVMMHLANHATEEAKVLGIETFISRVADIDVSGDSPVFRRAGKEDPIYSGTERASAADVAKMVRDTFPGSFPTGSSGLPIQPGRITGANAGPVFDPAKPGQYSSHAIRDAMEVSGKITVGGVPLMGA